MRDFILLNIPTSLKKLFGIPILLFRNKYLVSMEFYDYRHMNNGIVEIIKNEEEALNFLEFISIERLRTSLV